MSDKNNALRVFIDSNVLISAVLSQSSLSAKLLDLLIEDHQLIICSYSLTEVSRVIGRKFPAKMALWDKFLSTLEFELTYTPNNVASINAPSIRDPKDLPILVSAIIAQPDIFITGDLDFYTPEIQEIFTILSPADFIRTYYA